MNINVVIIDDQDIIRLGIQQSLGHLSHLTFLGGFADSASFCRSNAVQRADVVLLDDTLLGQDVLRAFQTIHAQCPHAAVLVLGSQLTAGEIHRLIRVGVMGIVCKNEQLQDMLMFGIQHVYEGRVYLSPNAALMAGRINLNPVLSSRLDDVLHLMARGYNVQQMARDLEISQRAIYNARARLRELLDVDTNEQVVAEALRRGLLRGD